MVEASCVYEVALATDELIPIEENWGLPPKYSLLDPAKVNAKEVLSQIFVVENIKYERELLI